MPQIETVRDMMLALQEEIEAIKKGELPVEAAKIVSRFRAQQLQVAQLQLQYERINRNPVKKGITDRNLLTGAAITKEDQTPAGTA